MKTKVVTTTRQISIPTEVGLDVDQVIDALSRIDYDYLIDQLTARKLIEPSEVSVYRKPNSSVVEEEFLQALDKLKFRYLTLSKEDINLIIELAKKS